MLNLLKKDKDQVAQMLPISIKHRDGVIYQFYNKSCLKKPKGKRFAFSKINQSQVSSFVNKFKADELLRINKLVKKYTNIRRDTAKKRIIRALSHGDLYVVSQDTVSPVNRSEMQVLRQEIKLLLNNLISIEQQESQKIEEEHKRRSGLEKAGEYVYETAAGLGGSVVSFLTWLKDVVELVSPTMQLIRQLEAAKVASNIDPKNWFVTYNSHLKASNHKELIDVLGFDYTKINQQQTNELFETAHFVWEDEETQIIITNFIKQYAAAQHSLEWANFAGSAAFDVILTALLAFFTGGAGAVASAGAKVGKLTGPLKKLGEKFVELGKLLKRSGVPVDYTPKTVINNAPPKHASNSNSNGNDGFDGDDKENEKGVTYEGGLYRSVSEGRDPLEIHPVYNVEKSVHRYSGEGQGGLYLGSSQRIVNAEFTGNGASIEGLVNNQYEVKVDGLLDLTDPKVRGELGVSLDDLVRTGGTKEWRYEVTNPLGRYAEQNGYNGIIAPSAQADGGVNAILFDSGLVK